MAICYKGKGKTCKQRQNKQQYFENDQAFWRNLVAKTSLNKCVLQEKLVSKNEAKQNNSMNIKMSLKQYFDHVL